MSVCNIYLVSLRIDNSFFRIEKHLGGIFFHKSYNKY